MVSPLVYLLNRFFYRLKEFLRHWYLNSFYIITHRTLNLLERLDRILALKITLRYWLKPLYQDYTLVGYLMGFIFRSWRIIIAAIVYSLIIAAAAAIYIVWMAIPLYVVYRPFVFK